MTNPALSPLALVGPTASGKTEASAAIAPALGAEILCVDSMLVYRGMDVGTAKPSPRERRRVRHHLLDVADPDERFSVARFQELARRAIDDVRARGVRPFLVGGSGLYYRAVVDGLAFPSTDPSLRRDLERQAEAVGALALHARLAAEDPAAARKIEPGNVRRTVRALEVAAATGRSFSSFAGAWDRYAPEAVRAAGVEFPPGVLAGRIERRVTAMLEGGFLDEVRGLAERGLSSALTSRQAIGYAEMLAHLEGRVSLEEAARRTVQRTKALARRQLAWFRRDPRVRWFRAREEGAAGLVEDLMEYYRA